MAISDAFSRVRRVARRKIDGAIRHGLLPLEDIATEVSSSLEGSLSDEIVQSMVVEAWQRTAHEHAKLGRPTPLERLQAAFDALDRVGIIARHFPQDGRSDALSLVRNELAVAEHAGRSYTGYCFYDRHLAELMSEGALAFCFGPAEPANTYAMLWRRQVEIGVEIAKALQREGFGVGWSGRPADPIQISGVVWSGPRDPSGMPTVPTGPRLEGEVRSPHDVADSCAVANVFVACSGGSTDAHRLLALIALHTKSSMWGSIETFATEPAAVAVELARGLVLDLVTGESRAGAIGLLRNRDFANECTVLVTMAAQVGVLRCPWWSQYPPERRIAVVANGDTSRHDGSIVVPIDLDARTGVTELLQALETIASTATSTRHPSESR